MFKVQTQIKDINTGLYYNIDAKAFESKFITKEGGISLPPGKSMSSSNYMTYAENVEYNIQFVLSNYVPVGGVVTIWLPKEIVIPQGADPYEALTDVQKTKFQKD